jgi:hypothetical protein
MVDTPQPQPTPPSHDGPPAPAPVGPDDRDINVRGVLAFAGGLMAITVATQLLLAWMFFALRHREDVAKRSQFPLSAPERAPLPQAELGAPVSGELPPEPRLEGLDIPNPQHDLGRLRQQSTAEASGHEEQQSAARIAIEEAMHQVADESKPQGHEPAPVRYDQGIPGTGGGSNSGRSLPEAKR